MPNVIAAIHRNVSIPVNTAEYPQENQYPRNTFRLIRCDSLLRAEPENLVVINFSPYPSMRDLEMSTNQKRIGPYVAVSHVWEPEPEISLNARVHNDVFNANSHSQDPCWLVPITPSRDGTTRYVRVRIKVLRAIADRVVKQGCDYFWLDVLSVEYRDAEDRKLQARHLHDIFRRAKCCIILHGGLGRSVIPNLQDESLERFLSSDQALPAVICPKPENVEILYGKHQPDK